MNRLVTAVAVTQSVERPFKGPSESSNSVTWVKIPALHVVVAKKSKLFHLWASIKMGAQKS